MSIIVFARSPSSGRHVIHTYCVVHSTWTLDRPSGLVQSIHSPSPFAKLDVTGDSQVRVSVCSGPGQSSRIIGSPPGFRKWRTTSATTSASSSCPATGMKSGTKSNGKAGIADEGDQQQLATPWHAGIARKTRDEQIAREIKHNDASEEPDDL